jgi:hypothetical protein
MVHLDEPDSPSLLHNRLRVLEDRMTAIHADIMTLADPRVPERLSHASIYCPQTKRDPRAMCQRARLFNLPQDKDRQFIGKEEDCGEATRPGERDLKTASFKRGNMSHSKTVVGENEFQWRVWEDPG